MLSWDDYRLVLAISRRGGLAGAAADLGVTLSTVFRRLEKVEAGLGAALFERLKGGYRATEEGRALALAAERMEHEALAADRAISGRDQQLTGAIRITTTEMLSVFFLAARLPSFCAAHPGLDVEVISDNRRLSLADRDADLALRIRRPTEPALFGRMIGRLPWAIYSADRVAAQYRGAARLRDLDHATFVAWEGAPPARAVAEWLDAEAPDRRILCRTTSLLAKARIAATGAAIAPLPVLIGAQTPGLTRIDAPIALEPPEIWLLTHEDLRRNARVRALMDFIATVAHDDRSLFEGDA